MRLLAALFVILLVLHQDLWNWQRANLWFGFLPIGLAYHAAFSMLCAVVGFAAIRFAWPASLVDEAEQKQQGDTDLLYEKSEKTLKQTTPGPHDASQAMTGTETQSSASSAHQAGKSTQHQQNRT